MLAVDTHYSDTACATSGVLFERWDDSEPAQEVTATSSNVTPYRPGEFYKRELPPILALLEALDERPSVIIVDGYVWLDAAQTPGLGAHLFRALNGETPIVGVAKSAFKGSAHAIEVLRGESRRPLYVTAAGMDREEAARRVKGMRGGHRIPDLLKRADELCRAALRSRRLRTNFIY